MPEILCRMGVHTHLVTGHYHYWQDGGATYHTRYVGLLSAFYPKCTAYFHLDFLVRLTSSSLSPLWKLLLHFTWDEKFISLLKIA